MDLGLLFGNEEETTEEENEWLSFPHKIIHEYIAAYYLVREIAKNQETLERFFPKWKSIKRHEEVYNFCIGCSSDAEQASVFTRHFCDVLSETMIWNVQSGQIELCHSRIYKIDTIVGKNTEMRDYSDKAELTQVFSAISREIGDKRDTCTNPVCNEYIHVYPACSNIDPSHISKSKLLVYTESVTPSRYLMGVSDNMTHRNDAKEKYLVIFGDKKKQDFACINQAMSLCEVAEIYMKDCTFEHSMIGDNAQNVSNLFTKSLESVYMKQCNLTHVLWTKIGDNLAGSKVMKSVMLRDCAGVTEHLVTCIASPITLTKLWLDGCNLSKDMCEVLCKKLTHLKSLEGLDLSRNPIGEHVAHITAAIRTWGHRAKLRMLYLASCKLPGKLVPSLLLAVTECCPEMQYLSIGGNGIGGCLPSFMEAAPASLRYLYVHKCNLWYQDVDSITTVLKYNSLPNLSYLDMENNSLSDTLVEPLLQAADTHHPGKLEVNLTHNNLSNEFTTRWSSQHRPKLHIYLHPQGQYQDELQLNPTCTIL